MRSACSAFAHACQPAHVASPPPLRPLVGARPGLVLTGPSSSWQSSQMSFNSVCYSSATDASCEPVARQCPSLRPKRSRQAGAFSRQPKAPHHRCVGVPLASFSVRAARLKLDSPRCRWQSAGLAAGASWFAACSATARRGPTTARQFSASAMSQRRLVPTVLAPPPQSDAFSHAHAAPLRCSAGM